MFQQRNQKRNILSLASLALVANVAADYTFPDPPNAFPGYKMVFSDEFNGNAIDSRYWTPDWDCTGWGNHARMAYTTSPKNVFVKDGELHINPIFGKVSDNPMNCAPYTGIPPCACDPNNANPIHATSAQISTRNKMAFQYGKVRTRARMARGYYTWTAFWLDPAKENARWPADGETDIMESVGKAPGWWSAVAHYEEHNGRNRAKAKNWVNNAYNFVENYYVFGLDWDETHLVWSIDEEPQFRFAHGEINEVGVNPYDKHPFYILLDVAIAGRMFGDGRDPDRGPAHNRTWPPYEMIGPDADQWRSATIDWLRIYQANDKINIQFTPEGARNRTVTNTPLPGSFGAVCPFDGCTPKTGWEEWVKDVEKSLPQIPQSQFAPGGVSVPNPDQGTSGEIAKPSTPGTSIQAPGSSNVAQNPSSSAGKVKGSFVAMVATFLGGLALF